MTHWKGGKTAVGAGLLRHELTAQVFNVVEGILMRPAVAVTTALLLRLGAGVAKTSDATELANPFEELCRRRMKLTIGWEVDSDT